MALRYGKFSAGSDTVGVSHKFCTFHSRPYNPIKTMSSMSCLILALVLSPHVQKRAQAELDLVVGRDRLPTFDDRPRLPYIEAICKEVVRWQLVAPLGSIISCQLHKSRYETHYLQEYLTHQLRIVFTGNFSCRKVCFVSVVRSSLR